MPSGNNLSFNPLDILRKYCADNAALFDVLSRHSMDVARRALIVVDAHPELHADRSFVYEAAMLHDIGCVMVDAPGIQCMGTEPYIRHGLLGGQILRAEHLPRHARVAERHTGTGLTVEAIRQQQLPLPQQDFSPETIEEKIVCYADKFYSKSRLDAEKSYDQVLHSLRKFGPEDCRRFEQWHAIFG